MSRKLLDTDFSPGVRSRRADVQPLLVSKEEDPPEQQEWSPSLDQGDQPELPHIKEEQEELWINEGVEHLRGLKEADIKFTFNSVHVKSDEDDEEKPQSSQLHLIQAEQMKTEADGEDCAESAGNFNPGSNLQPATHDETSHSSEPDTDDSCDWENTREPLSGLNPLQNNEVLESDMELNTGKTSVSSSAHAASFGHKGHMQKHNESLAEVKSFSCTVCGKGYLRRDSLRVHMKIHTEGKCFSCSVCKKTFQQSAHVVNHMRIHTGEKPFSCSICGKRFTHKENLKQHMRIHTGEKPFSCSVCGLKFARKGTLRRHAIVHTGEKPFSCSICGKGFSQSYKLATHLRVHVGKNLFTCSVCKTNYTNKDNLSIHMKIHTGEKPISCAVCGKEFARKGRLTEHMIVHSEEKPFSCSVCGKGFTGKGHLRTHMYVHTGEKPFNCIVCHKRFTRVYTLKKHLCSGESSKVNEAEVLVETK